MGQIFAYEITKMKKDGISAQNKFYSGNDCSIICISFFVKLNFSQLSEFLGVILDKVYIFLPLPPLSGGKDFGFWKIKEEIMILDNFCSSIYMVKQENWTIVKKYWK